MEPRLEAWTDATLVQLRVVVRCDTDDRETWIAQCLEYDLATQAPSLSELLMYELPRIIAAHVRCCEQEGLDPWTRNGDPLPAPPEFFDEYAAGAIKVTVDVDAVLRAWKSVAQISVL
jgi:hypothetical protein